MNKRIMSRLIAALSFGVAVSVSAVQDGVQTHALNAKISANDKTGGGRSGIIAEFLAKSAEERAAILADPVQKAKFRNVTPRPEDGPPRFMAVDSVPNMRDIGGWIGLDGRRIRQGLMFRSAGLNNNAPVEYYSLDEIKKLHAEGKLAGMGETGKTHADQLDRGEKLRQRDMRLVKRSCYAPGKERLTAEERARILSMYGFKTDIDLRRPREVYGMTGSPLGPAVAWVNIPLIGGYGSFADDKYFDCKRQVFRTLFDTNSYPVVFHCIGGADRTGTIALMVEALLGVDTNTLALDYLATGFVGGVTDAKHKGWFDSMMKTLADLPGDTNAEKMNGVFLRMGFSQKEIDDFREFMLEPNPQRTK